MLLNQIPDGAHVMVDSNIFLYAHDSVPVVGRPCDEFLQRVKAGDIEGFASATIVAEVIQRVLCSEAIRVHGVTPSTVVRTLRNNPDLVKGLTEHLTIPEGILAMNIVILPVTADALVASKVHRQAFGLLSNDSVIVAVMEAYGLTQIATHNGDFDRVSTIQIYKPAP